MQKTILITWWLWYIWSHWVIAFEEAWYKTIIIDNLSNTSIDVLWNIEKVLWKKVDFFQMDLREKEKLEDIFSKYKFDWVVHFAWLKAVWESCEKPLEYHDNNIIWSIILFQVMEKFSCKKIIFSSSATVYSYKNSMPLSEESIIWDTTNPYWTTKFVIEQLLKDYANHASWKIANLRYFNPIWAHKSWYLWEDPKWIPNNLLPYVMKVATWELKEVWVFWDDYETIDGTWVRDYIDVVDLVDWHLKAYEFIEKIEEKWIFETFNLWVWKWISVLEIIKIVSEVVWKEIPNSIKPRRSWDLWLVYSSPKKANEMLDWYANTDIKESIKKAWKFYNK